jgi:hypothetical protein
MVDPKLLIGRNISLVSSQPVLALCIPIRLDKAEQHAD